MLVSINGSVKVSVTDQDSNNKVYSLNKPNVGLYIPPMIWKDMYDFSHDALLLVLSSEYYEANEYIRDYELYLQGG